MIRNRLPLMLAALSGLALLAACGSTTKLRPLPGMGSVPKAAAANAAETPSQLMTPSTQAEPARSADLLTKSVERKQDPFDLPPGPNNGVPGAADNAAQAPAPAGNH